MNSNFPFIHAESVLNEHHPLIALHGWDQSLNDLKPLSKWIKHARSLHLIDLPGFGKSQAPSNFCEVVDYAHLIKQYLDQNNISKTDLFGHSFGGKIALLFSLHYPQCVSKLILTGASALKKKRKKLDALKLSMINGSGKSIKLIDRLLKTTYFEKYFIDCFGSTDYKKSSGVMRNILVKSVNLDLSEHLSKIHIPTLLLWGEDDVETPLEIAKRMQKLMPNCALISFPQKGHYFINGVGSHLAARYLLPFLKD